MPAFSPVPADQNSRIPGELVVRGPETDREIERAVLSCQSMVGRECDNAFRSGEERVRGDVAVFPMAAIPGGGDEGLSGSGIAPGAEQGFAAVAEQ